MHRTRLFNSDSTTNLAIRILKVKVTYPEYFAPTKQFYNATGIGQRRWWLIYKGKEKMTGKEFSAVVHHLKISDKEVLETLQLELFSNVL